VIGGRQLVVDRDAKNADAAVAVTRSMPGHGAGRLSDFPHLPRPLMTISVVFPPFDG